MAIKKTAAPCPVIPPCFKPEALKFLRALAKNNDRAWFQPRKAEYEAVLRAPMLAVIEAVNAAMEEFAPEHLRPAEKVLFRIYRDTRFAADKSPYKTHVGAWWVRQGLEKTSGAGFYLQVDPKEVLVAAGAYMPAKEQLAAIRHWLLDHHEELRSILKQVAIRKTFAEMEGNPLVRAPKGFPEDHAGMDLIRCRQWGLCATYPAEFALEAGFAQKVIRDFKLATPLVRALNTALVVPVKARQNALFRLP